MRGWRESCLVAQYQIIKFSSEVMLSQLYKLEPAIEKDVIHLLLRQNFLQHPPLASVSQEHDENCSDFVGIT